MLSLCPQDNIKASSPGPLGFGSYCFFSPNSLATSPSSTAEANVLLFDQNGMHLGSKQT